MAGRAAPLAKRLRAKLRLRIAGLELGLALLVVPVGAALLLFAALAEELLEGESLGFDRAILLALRNPLDLADPLGPYWLERVIAGITTLGDPAVLTALVLIVCGFLLLQRKSEAGALVIVTSLGAGLLNLALKTWFDRPRPDLVAHLVEVSTPSFPSGHALLSASIYLTLGVLLARVQAQRLFKIYCTAVAASLTLLVGLSRIYLGVHWPSDVLAGWCVGSAWAMTCWLIAGWLQQRGLVEGSPPGG